MSVIQAPTNSNRKFETIYCPNNTKHPFEYNLYDGVKHIINFQDKRVLDFGGSWGNLIKSSAGKIKPENYTCLDIDYDAIEKGRCNFSDATWIHYNKYNIMYNKTGSADTKIKDYLKDTKYDIIFAYSVFTHTVYEDFVDTINALKKHLTSTGKIYVSVCLQQDTDLLAWYKNRRLEEFDSHDDYVLNDTVIYISDYQQISDDQLNTNCRYFLTFYNTDFIKKHGKLHYDMHLPQTLLEIK